MHLQAAGNPASIRVRRTVMGSREGLSCSLDLRTHVPVGTYLGATGRTVIRIMGLSGELSRAPCQGRCSPVPRPWYLSASAAPCCVAPSPRPTPTSSISSLVPAKRLFPNCANTVPTSSRVWPISRGSCGAGRWSSCSRASPACGRPQKRWAPHRLHVTALMYAACALF